MDHRAGRSDLSGLTAFSLAWLGLYLCRGKLDLFQLGGLAAGAAAYFLLLGKPLGRLFRAFWHTVARGFHLLLWPWKMLGKKVKIFAKFLFSTGRKWGMIWMNRYRRIHVGGKAHENARQIPPVRSTDQAADSVGGGFVRRLSWCPSGPRFGKTRPRPRRWPSRLPSFSRKIKTCSPTSTSWAPTKA